MNMVDDATGHTMPLMAQAETTEAAMGLLWQWVKAHGIPKALYTDKKNVFVTDREPTLEEELAGQEPMTAFGNACAKLGIEIIAANSPQAKGRVERKHGVYQDRLVKDLAMRGIKTIEETNKLLNNGFVKDLNAKFARAPLNDTDFHQPVPKGLDLADVFCLEEPRAVQNDWTIRYENRHFQIIEANKPMPRPKEKVIVRIRMDKTMTLIYREKALAFRAIPALELAQPTAEQPRADDYEPERPRKRSKPAQDHPWRKAAKRAAAKKANFRL